MNKIKIPLVHMEKYCKFTMYDRALLVFTPVSADRIPELVVVDPRLFPQIDVWPLHLRLEWPRFRVESRHRCVALCHEVQGTWRGAAPIKHLEGIEGR